MSHFITGSGYLNNPVRTILIADDNRPGSYPVDVSPISAAKSSQYSKPYRDNVMPDTRVVYGQAKVVFAAVPNDGETITITNAKSQAHTFTFKYTSPNFVTGPTSYDVAYSGISTAPRLGDEGLTQSQIITKRALEKFVQAVNTATGSLITASPTQYYNTAILTQQIPGTAGNNTSNSTTSADVTIGSFTGGNAGEVRYPFGITVSGSGEVLGRVISTSASGTLDVPTSGKASLLSAYSDGHPYAVFHPYNEANSEQSFGITEPEGRRIYGTKTKLYDEFFTRGSVSGSLDEPLRVKDKLVIDLTPNKSTTLFYSCSNSTPIDVKANSYTMAYFNHESRTWERIGFGRNVAYATLTAVSPFAQSILDKIYVGFGQSDGNRLNRTNDTAIFLDTSYEFEDNKRYMFQCGWASPTDTFGFPYNPKYHATGSQTFKLSSIIDRPFVVEKMVYEFSGSNLGSPYGSEFVNFATDPDGSSIDRFFGGGGTFFILNQRQANPDTWIEDQYTRWYDRNGSARPIIEPAGTIQYYEDKSVISSRHISGAIPALKQLTPGGQNVYVDDVRDLVTFARVGAISSSYYEEVENTFQKWSKHPAQFMDLVIETEDGGFFDGKFTLASEVKSPNKAWPFSYFDAGAAFNYPSYTSKYSSTRNSIDIPTGRSLRSEFGGSSQQAIFDMNPASSTAFRVIQTDKDFSNSPYVLHPSDELIFGWQCPFGFYDRISTSNFVNGQYSSKLTISPGAGKLTLYGSYLQDDKPVHNIYKDQLNSDAAHEAIPSGPWILDRFETEPQMMYSSSMREEYVVGTMLRTNGSSIAVTDVNSTVYDDFFTIPVNDFGVRRVVRRASDGGLSSALPISVVPWRYSFSRQIRLRDSTEQYYDSMQPDPVSILFKPSNVRAGVITGAGPGGYVTLMLEGEDFKYTPDAGAETAINQYSNRKFIGSFPFEPYYSGIRRVKRINSKTIKGRQVPAWTDLGATISLINSYMDYGPTYITGTIGPGEKSNLARKGGVYASTTGLSLHPWTFIPNVIPYGDTNPVKVSSIGYGYFRDESTDPIDDINYYASRFMGCFGNGYLGIIQSTSLIPISNVTGKSQLTFYMQYRGTKHGLINPTPLFSNAVFSGTRFGQLRDMMEQRQYTRFSLNNNTLTDAAVSVQFINRSATPGTLNITSGSATNSSNISKFATSEHPYDDALADIEEIWDRDTPLPETLIAI